MSTDNEYEDIVNEEMRKLQKAQDLAKEAEVLKSQKKENDRKRKEMERKAKKEAEARMAEIKAVQDRQEKIRMQQEQAARDMARYKASLQDKKPSEDRNDAPGLTSNVNGEQIFIFIAANLILFVFWRAVLPSVPDTYLPWVNGAVLVWLVFQIYLVVRQVAISGLSRAKDETGRFSIKPFLQQLGPYLFWSAGVVIGGAIFIVIIFAMMGRLDLLF